MKVKYQGEWYDAIVTNYNQSANTYDIEYLDGSVGHNIPSWKVKFEEKFSTVFPRS